MDVESLGDFESGLFLKRKNILQVAGEIVGPGLKTGAGIDQLDVDANLIARLTDTAFEEIANTELTTDVGRGLVGKSKSGHGRARSQIHTLDFGEVCGDFIGHAVAEVGAVRLGAEILQGKHGDGRPSCGSGSMDGGVFAIPEPASDGEERGEAEASRVQEAARGLSCDGRNGWFWRVVQILAAAGNSGRRRLMFDGIESGLNGRAAGGFALEALEVGAEFRGGLAAEIAIFFEGFVDDAFEFGGSLRIKTCGRQRSTAEDAVEDGGGSVALERKHASGHFVEDDAKRKKIAADIERFAESLFGRHVSDRADGAAGTGEDRKSTRLNSSHEWT